MGSEMMKSCVILNGTIINIGEWDYDIRSVEITPAILDDEGNVVTEATYEDQSFNPLPEGATIEERDIEYNLDNVWYEVGVIAPPNLEERIRITEDWILEKMLGGM